MGERERGREREYACPQRRKAIQLREKNKPITSQLNEETEKERNDNFTGKLGVERVLALNSLGGLAYGEKDWGLAKKKEGLG